MLKSPATKKIMPSYIKEFEKQLLKNATQTTKSLLTFQPTKTIPKQLNPKVPWQIKRRYNPYNPIFRRCNLCLNKKLEILDDQDKNLLNKRSKIISYCRHQKKVKLKTLASNTADTNIPS